MTTQGGQANKTGNVLEQLVIGTLSTHGFKPVKYTKFIKHREIYGKELLLMNVPYETIYNHRGYTEFLLLSDKFKLIIRIECKWQQKGGSVDEKLPYVYLSAINALPENDIIILIDGNGFRDGAIQWIREAANKRIYIPEEKNEKNIRIMNSTEFLTWCNEKFK